MSVDINALPSNPTSTPNNAKPVTPVQSQLQQFNDNTQAKKSSKKKTEENVDEDKTVTPKVSVQSDADITQNIDTSPPDLTPAMKSVGDFLNGISVKQGLGVAIAILIAAIWLLIPTASGDTRAKLLWLTITGQTKIADVHGTGVSDNGSSPSVGTGGIPDTSLLATGQGPSQDQLHYTGTDITASTNIPIDFSALNMYGID